MTRSFSSRLKIRNCKSFLMIFFLSFNPITIKMSTENMHNFICEIIRGNVWEQHKFNWINDNRTVWRAVNFWSHFPGKMGAHFSLEFLLEFAQKTRLPNCQCHSISSVIHSWMVLFFFLKSSCWVVEIAAF